MTPLVGEKNKTKTTTNKNQTKQKTKQKRRQQFFCTTSDGAIEQPGNQNRNKIFTLLYLKHVK